MSAEVIIQSIFFFVVMMGGLASVWIGINKLYALPMPKPDPEDPFAWGRGASSVMICWITSGFLALIAGGYVGYFLGQIPPK